jgi:hypothetical protein
VAGDGEGKKVCKIKKWSDRLIHNAGRATFSREFSKALNI